MALVSLQETKDEVVVKQQFKHVEVKNAQTGLARYDYQGIAYPIKEILSNHRNPHTACVCFFVSLHFAQAGLARCGKQKTHNLRYGFPFAEKEGFEPPEV